MVDWEIFFNIFLKNSEVFFEYVFIIDENIFKENVLANIFLLSKRFANKYKKIPTWDTIILLLDKLPDKEKERKEEYLKFISKSSACNSNVDIDAFKDEVYRRLKKYEMEKLILKTASKIEEATFDSMISEIRNINSKFVQKSLGVDVTDVKRMISFIRHDTSEKVSSGIDSLDRLLYGGFGVGEIVIMMAPPGRGKSFFLLNVMYGAMLSQKNVLYITFELYEKSVLRRLYSRIGYMTKKDMLDEETMIKYVSKFFGLTKTKSRIVYQPSRSMSVDSVESFIEQQILYFDNVPDILIVDYLDLLSPRAMDARLEMRHRLKGITEELRSISVRRSIPLVTATQANRASLAKIKITEANVSEAFGKVEVADVILALCQTEEEKKVNRARVVVLKNRDYVSGGCIEVYVDFSKMLMLDLEVAEKMGVL